MTGQLGPWENRTHLATLHPSHRPEIGTRVVALHLDPTYSVQRFQYDDHPRIDHLVIRRHDGGIDVPWWDRQRIKDRLAPDGVLRVGLEVFPPSARVVDDRDLFHLWVMPFGWSLGFGLHPMDSGTVEPMQRLATAHALRQMAEEASRRGRRP